MSRVTFSHLSRQDLETILDFVAERNPSAAPGFISDIRDRCAALGEFPGMGRARPEFRGGDLRSLSAGHYVIFYRVRNGGVEVVRSLHGARDLATILNRPSEA